MDIDRLLEYYFHDALEKPQLHEERVKECIPDASLPSENGCFDCNICLDFATEPVVTLCGHLYCWPCVYKWLHVEGVASQQCPVCKAPLSQNSLVPLYGHSNGAARESYESFKIPSRPSARPESVASATQTNEQHPTQQRQNGRMSSSPWPMETRVFHSTAGGVLGGIMISILRSVFRNLETEPLYRRPYPIDTSRDSPRLRRQEMRAERSLNQICGFLSLFAITCLLFF